MNVEIRKKNDAHADPSLIARLADKLGLHKRLVELLVSRGIDTEDAILRFIRPEESDFNDPFCMKNMREIVTRINSAIDSGEKIVVYGDYDADGVCSASILSLYFSSRGSDVIVHIPDRMSDGYGLSIASIEDIIEQHAPDLIVTCDCGISGIAEVEHCLDLGVDIIVTDHHEPGEVLPDCPILNPKQAGDDYPDKYLCGAGVALKLVQALCGDDSYKEYLDLAAVATVADLVPLLGENRLIVQHGLRMLSRHKGNIGLRRLLRAQGLSGEIRASDIAYKIAPRINAAGRMGDAFRAFDMLTTSDAARIDEVIRDIETDNERRKKLCDEIYAEAEADLAYEDLSTARAIVLCNPEWAKGVTGIAAARFAGDYHRPTFIIVDRNEEGVFKGTARGIAGVNVYEALTYCSDLLVEYGGHTGAAGFSISEDMIPEFKKRVNEYMAGLPEQLFMPSAEYDIDIDAAECDGKLLTALDKIEPTGNGNTKPRLRTVTDDVTVTPCKNPQHSCVHIGRLQTYAFNFFAKNQFLLGNGKKQIVFELTEGLNGGVSGYVKAVSSDDLYINDETAPANFLFTLMMNGSRAPVYKTYKENELSSLAPTSIYGTLFVCADRAGYYKALSTGGKFVTCDYMYKTERNNYSGIIVSPSFGQELALGNYSRIVFTDSPPSLGVISALNEVTRAEIYIPEARACRQLDGLSTDRAVFGKYYSAMAGSPELYSPNHMLYYKRLSKTYRGLDARQFAVCLAVFTELGFFDAKDGKLKVTGAHRPLDDSETYRILSEHAAHKA